MVTDGSTLTRVLTARWSSESVGCDEPERANGGVSQDRARTPARAQRTDPNEKQLVESKQREVNPFVLFESKNTHEKEKRTREGEAEPLLERVSE